MSSEIMNIVFKALIGIVSIVLTYKGIPLIKAVKLNIAEKGFDRWLNIAVRFCEQEIKGRGMGLEKKNAVIGFAKERFDVDEEELKMAISALVNELNSTDWKV